MINPNNNVDDAQQKNKPELMDASQEVMDAIILSSNFYKVVPPKITPILNSEPQILNTIEMPQIVLIDPKSKNPRVSYNSIPLVCSIQISADGHEFPVRLICVGCKQNIITETSRKVGTQTILLGIIIAIITLGICCLCIIPCIRDDCKDVVHHCPSCQRRLGTKKYIINDN